MLEKYFIGVDIGGTKTLAALSDSDGQILEKRFELTDRRFIEGLAQVKGLIRSLAKGRTINRICVAAGGPIEPLRGIVSSLHFPEWENVPLDKLISAEFDCPVRIESDTNAAAFAEYLCRKSTSRLLYVGLGTGMGGAFILDGLPYRGQNGWHPEFGHQAIPFRLGKTIDLRCSCGSTACLEMLVSGTGIRHIYGKLIEEFTSEELSEYSYNLAMGLRNLAVCFVPETIILGGAVGISGGQRLIEATSEILQREVNIIPAPRLAISQLGAEATLHGAIAIALKREHQT